MPTVKLIIIWSLLLGGPGDHGQYNRQLREAARRAATETRANGDEPRYVACMITHAEPDGGPSVDTVLCAAAPGPDGALVRLWRHRRAPIRGWEDR